MKRSSTTVSCQPTPHLQPHLSVLLPGRPKLARVPLVSSCQYRHLLRSSPKPKLRANCNRRSGKIQAAFNFVPPEALCTKGVDCYFIAQIIDVSPDWLAPLPVQ